MNGFIAIAIDGPSGAGKSTMARKLAEANAMMLVGGGVKGVGPLVMSTGGTPYRAFLEGRIQGDSYALILRLTNLELKSL